jgi:hypothetical protein
LARAKTPADGDHSGKPGQPPRAPKPLEELVPPA